ncbi:MAG: DUF6452 family protein [Cyclobacteriaceae bacterium]
MKKIIILLVYVFCAFWFACAPEPACLDETPEIKLSFFKEVYSDTDSATFINDTTIAFVEVAALGTDSIFVVQDTTFSLTLPLNAAASQVEYLFRTIDVFDMSGEINHTLQIEYLREQQLVSEDCGPVQLYSELELVSGTFDSVAIVNNTIDPDIDVNVEVYR